MFSAYISLLFSFTILGTTYPQSRCRCLYGEPCWPTDTEFSSLATQLSQPLLRPVPPASPCYPSPEPPVGNCSNVQALYHDGKWRSDQPGSMQNTNFEAYWFENGTIDACYLEVNLGLPRKQGSIPPIGVDVRTVEDAQAAVKFADRKNLRLVVKNTGHDFLGRSTARGGFLLWTHNLKDKVYDAQFVPKGAPPSETFEAVTFGAGVQWHEAYDFVEEQGRFIVGGISVDGSVGSAGGWVMGGGYSAFSRSLGLGVDNVLEFTVVLSDGTLVTTNAHRYTDLFWALRGGGGGTYGVVLAATYRTHPKFPLVMPTFELVFSSPEDAQSVVTELFKLHTNLSDAGWGGYIVILPPLYINAIFLVPNTTVENANKILEPFVNFATSATGPEGVILHPTQAYGSFIELWRSNFGFELPGPVGGNTEIASRLLPMALAKDHPEEAARIVLSVDGVVATNLVAGGAVSRVDPSAMGLNPSWRRAVAQVCVIESWPNSADSATILSARARLKKNTDLIDQLTQDSGSYLNEGSLYERDFKKSYFGPHYPKLKKIKQKYDPLSLFVVASGVGSEEWDAELRCRK